MHAAVKLALKLEQERKYRRRMKLRRERVAVGLARTFRQPAKPAKAQEPAPKRKPDPKRAEEAAKLHARIDRVEARVRLMRTMYPSSLRNDTTAWLEGLEREIVTLRQDLAKQGFPRQAV
jgi:hypothetical protein